MELGGTSYFLTAVGGSERSEIYYPARLVTKDGVSRGTHVYYTNCPPLGGSTSVLGTCAETLHQGLTNPGVDYLSPWWGNCLASYRNLVRHYTQLTTYNLPQKGASLENNELGRAWTNQAGLDKLAK